jgi:apolipoprotein N-acyltransferase
MTLKKSPSKKIALVIGSAVLIILSFPRFSWSFLAWVALVPFFKTLEDMSSGQRFKIGYLTGILSSLGIFYWVTHSMRYYGGLDLITSISILLLMVLYLALYFGAFAWLWGLYPRKGFLALFWAPSVWVGLEFIRSYFLTGFPWAMLGHSQYNFIFIIQISEITGVYGISFLIVMVNQMLFQLISPDVPFFGWSGKWKETVFTLLLFFLTFWFGYFSVSNQDRKDKEAPIMRTAVIQGNIDQSLKWDPSYQEQTIRIYRDLSQAAFPKNPELIIWPETAVPFYFLNENRLSPALFQLAREGQAHLLFGSPAYGFKNGEPEYYNRAYLLSPEGRIHFYDKVHLVPFGEYVPLKRLLPFVGKIVQAIGDFKPGPGSYGLPYPKAKIGVLICFETIFPELSRTYKQDGCRILVNMTNDAWFGRTSAPYQHLSILVFRAVENRLWVARAANTGFSAVIDSSGRIVKQVSLFQSGWIYANIPLRGERTFYSRQGDWLIIFCGLIFLAGLIVNRIKYNNIFQQPGNRINQKRRLKA